MLKKSVSLVVFAALLVGFTGCKGKNESNGDSHFKKGNFRNAVNSYTNALQKGKISDEFYDSFVIAYASAAKQTARRNPSDEIISNYFEQIHRHLPKINPKFTSKKGTLDSVVVALSEIGLAQVKGNFGYEYTLQGFRSLDSAISIAKRGNTNANPSQLRREAEKEVVTQAIENSEGAENDVAAEYALLEAEVVAPNDENLKKALNAMRLKNRGTWLIFAEDLIGQPASRLVDKYGYVIAFPSLSLTAAGGAGEIAVWNATGNNVAFDVNRLRLVSTSGEEVSARYTGGGWCAVDRVERGKFVEARVQFKGSVGELRSEKTCNAKLSFTFPRNFVPDYVEYKDANNNIGRKYLGQR
ncbi:MAG: hypothetical protein LBU89_14800 [Fibromonadaceae bacterium]|jgi:hypothetical protein|nr:hypothetical protein [Fibromonadaceae bacterium]